MAMLGLGFSFGRRSHGGGADARFRFAEGVLPAGATFARSTAATCYDASGVMRTAAIDEPRFDHDPVDGAYRGLLIEPAATNLKADSEVLSAGWSAIAGTSFADNVANAPDGEATADKIVEDSSDGIHRALMGHVMVEAGEQYTLSIFLKAQGSSQFSMDVRTGATIGRANVDLDTGTVQILIGSGAIEALEDDWFRLSLSGVTTETRLLAYIFMMDDSGSTKYLGDTSSGILTWATQVEAGAVASYIATTDTPATRAADVLTLDWGQFGIADGALAVRYSYGDGSSEDAIMTVSGGVAAVPSALARPHLMEIVAR